MSNTAFSQDIKSLEKNKYSARNDEYVIYSSTNGQTPNFTNLTFTSNGVIKKETEKPLQFKQTYHNKVKDNSKYVELRKKILSFRRMKPDDVFDEPPDQSACDIASQALDYMHDNNIYPNLLSASQDGGVMFEFYVNDNYILIEIHNSGEIIYFSRDELRNVKVYECKITKLLNLIQTHLTPIFNR
ncbi:hypothetical protein COW36_05285 [bacterium (Candidatus Blackallbacteria) CG17_big_fil_post_rev_8_21_14_2_50_48_46]|uniref:Uncharacterized protein n=1 Tax=bacterium (Candidatus Blackallbacteria) CG17_big_fil_post_rev_8_21_14_2_50_48_46 TaxID=2014261 RepID=A0A2M7G9D0_9BACT|nr:MAG: hypothetical protein COW64_03655 [bacterium (Candidatus Blackallbacteria) CG18_big_fil_WC_8_21_14_2_50_49_26]PIW18710.1 MAG: hypothetical protein COW36_05285 [bacterium (Candidatus Blackallbacteria) CG17_big_fil_post_rev_8_21_14_2_50_48_46]PIW46304.1 MAG: hypothetical protein COW20_15395 [bacterium (Candidatus Blackallbacteria) CG13_big_fil_rev_8_21_14_2_50_49_14]